LILGCNFWTRNT